MKYLAKWTMQVTGYTPSEGTLCIQDAESCCDATIKALRHTATSAAHRSITPDGHGTGCENPAAHSGLSDGAGSTRSDMKTDSIEAEFLKVLRSDALVHAFFGKQQGHRMRRRDKRFKALVVALCEQKAQLMKHVIQLEAIAPRRLRAPDGKVYLHQCPAHLVPIQDIKA